VSVVAPPQYRCGNPRRREAVRAHNARVGPTKRLNGIDFLDVGPDQTTIEVHLLERLPGTGRGAVPRRPALSEDNLVILGGTSVRDLRVTRVEAAADLLTVVVDRPGDFSPYELRIVDPLTGGAVPAGFDPQLARVTFSFKAGCPSDLDCATPEACPPEVLPEPQLDYLAKDYDSFRRLLLDRLATTLPGWTERNPADLGVVMVELLAYAADRLSYFQDAVATEAYLGTARRRVSVRRHARLLDYRVHEGCNARTFVWFGAETGLTLPAGTAVRAGSVSPALVFETLHPVVLRPAHQAIAFHTWSDERCCLPAGAVRATLRGGPDVALAAGDLLLLEETRDPATGADPDPAHRQVVRLTTPPVAGIDPLDGTPVLEVAWDAADALTFPLCVSSQEHGATAVARANLALADHGATREDEPLPDEDPSPPGPWRPLVSGTPLTFAVPYDPEAPAARLLGTDPRTALPAVTLRDGEVEWLPAADLLGAGPTTPVFVVEVEEDGETRLRFGDDQLGLRPPRGAGFRASYRVGNGAAGNLAAEAIDRLVTPVDGVTLVRNPLPAAGGSDPEPTERVRQTVPRAYRRQERAVTEADYAAVAERFGEVQRAAARLRWTGSWYTAFATVDRVGGGAPDDDDLGDRLRDFLDTFRMAGIDVDVGAPVPVPIELALDVCVAPGYLAAQVEEQVFDALSAAVLPDGRRGFFHPDHLTFGQPVYLSQVYAQVLAVPGVAWTQATSFRRLGRPDAGELAAGVLRVQGLEVAQLAGDPSFPERGRLTLTVVGGR
jgi:hypothetical protein